MYMYYLIYHVLKEMCIFLGVCVCVCVCDQSCATLCDPMDCSPLGSSIHGNLQARILEWVAIPFSRDQTRISCISCIAGGFFTAEPPGKPFLGVVYQIQFLNCY